MRFFCMFVALPVLALQGAAGQGSTGGGAVQTFAEPDMAGQVMGLSVDDAGRVFVSSTARAFGRGVAAVTDEKRRREDRAVFSLDERRAATLRWREADGVKFPEGEPEERVICLTDMDRDGRADRKVVVADGFGDILDGPAGGVLALPGGRVLFACTPALWRLEDENGDAVADRRPPVQTGFGIRTGDSGPGLRALAAGPDGMIYFTTTSRGVRVDGGEGRRFLVEGSGAVFRCRTDGSGMEQLATGLRDPAGIVVDGRGRIYVADAGPDEETSRLLLVLPGADFGWDEAIPERKVFEPGPRPAWMLPELALLKGRATGLAEMPVAGNGARFPVLIMADGRSGGGLVTVRVEETAEGFSAVAGAAVWQGGAANGVTVAPDGAVLWADWDKGLAAGAACRIQRLPVTTDSTVWHEGAGLLAEDVRKAPAGDLAALLEHGHPLVRWRARQALEAAGFLESLDVFTRVAKRSPSLPARLNAVWGLGTMAQEEPMLMNEAVLLFASAEPDIRALAVRLAGGGPAENGETLLPLLHDPAKDVRIEAAFAVAGLRPPGGIESLVAALETGVPEKSQDEDEGQEARRNDAFTRHAQLYALSRMVSPVRLAAQGREAPAAEALWIVQVLRMQRAAELADLLEHSDPAVVFAAAEAIFDGMILPAYPAMAGALRRSAGQPELREAAFVRRALAAALRTGTAVEAEAVAIFAGLPEEAVAAELRESALLTLTQWDDPPAEEPVHGRADRVLPRPPGIARAWLGKLQPGTAARPSAEALTAIIGKSDAGDAARIDALQQYAAMQPAKALELARSYLPARSTAVFRSAARGLIMKLEPAASSYAQISEALAFGSPQEMQTVLQMAIRFDSKQSETLWLELGKKYTEKSLNPAVRVEVLEGLTARDVATRGKFRRLLETMEAAIPEENDPLARWRICETGGDSGQGLRVFETGRALNCTACHSVNGRGGTAGPELDGVARRLDRDGLLAALVHPSAHIAAGYGHAIAALQDGTEVAGLVRSRDDAGTVLVTEGGLRRIDADAIKAMTGPASEMPPAGALLTMREIRDLIAWLETLK